MTCRWGGPRRRYTSLAVERRAGAAAAAQRPYVMQHETRPLDYRTVPPVERLRPRLWLSHMRTAAVLCFIALLVDRQLRYDREDALAVALIEVALAVYGVTCAAVSMSRGALTRGDKVTVAGCLLLFAFTSYVGLLMPRVIHN